ncbi:hypothetical protein EJB05_08198, partial [Eragrostis curvula]
MLVGQVRRAASSFVRSLASLDGGVRLFSSSAAPCPSPSTPSSSPATPGHHQASPLPGQLASADALARSRRWYSKFVPNRPQHIIHRGKDPSVLHAPGFGFKEPRFPVGMKMHPFTYARLYKPLIWWKIYGEDPEVITSEAGKELYHSLIHLLEDNHANGLSLPDNFTPAMLQVNHLGRLEMIDKLVLQPATEKSKARDYYMGALAIVEISQHSYHNDITGRMPDDLRELVKKMKDPKSPKGYRMLVDPSLMPLHFRSPASNDVYHFLFDELGYEERKDFFRDLAEDFKAQQLPWTKIAESNVLLAKFLWYKKPGDEALLPRYDDSPQSFLVYIRCVNAHPLEHNKKGKWQVKTQQQTSREVDAQQQDDSQNLVRDEVQKLGRSISAEDSGLGKLMEMDRQNTEHQKEGSESVKADANMDGPQNKRRRYTKDDLQLLLQSRFSYFLPYIYDWLEKKGYLRSRRPDIMFVNHSDH